MFQECVPTQLPPLPPPPPLTPSAARRPVVNVLNFKYVPPHQRVLAMNLCAIAWNSYLSYISTAPLPSDKEGQK